MRYTLETLQDRSYPLYDHIFAYFDRAPGKPMNPAVLEFVKFTDDGFHRHLRMESNAAFGSRAGTR